MKKIEIAGHELTLSEEDEARLKERYLGNYLYLSRRAKELSKEDALRCLWIEQQGQDRHNMKYRLYSIFNVDRRKHETKELGIERKPKA